MRCFSSCSPLFSSFLSDTSLCMSFLLTLTDDPCPQPLLPPLYYGATLQSWGAFVDFWCVSGGDPLCGCSICSVQASVQSEAIAGNLAALTEDFSLPCLGGMAIFMILTSGVQDFHSPQFSPICLPTKQLGSFSLHKTPRLEHSI